MTEIVRILDQMNNAFEKDAWCGLSLKESLDGVTADLLATRRPLPTAHTIWEIVLHVSAWKDATCPRLDGDIVPIPAEGDYPPVSDTGETSWRDTLRRLDERHFNLSQTVQEMTDSRLEQKTTKGGLVSVYQTLHGMIQHDLYHAAQISILKKS